MPAVPVNPDEILKEIHDLKETLQEDSKTIGERLAETEARAVKALEAVDELRKQNLQPTTPLPIELGAFADQRGGMFDGRAPVPYKRMLEMPLNDPTLVPSDRERVARLHELHTAMVIRFDYLARKKPAHEDQSWIIREIRKAPEFPAYASAMVAAGYARAANDVLNPGGGEGANLDFTLLTGTLLERIALASRVSSQFQTITLPRAKTDYPALRADTIGIWGGGTTKNPVTDADNIAAGPAAVFRLFPDLGSVGFACEHCLGYFCYNDDMLEDSVVPLLPMLTEQAVIMIARAKDQGAISGDSVGGHMDSDVTGGNDFRKAIDGLRIMGSNNTATITAAITSADFNTLRIKLGKWGEDPGQLVMFLNVTDWLKLNTDTDLKSAAVVGLDRATLRTGVVDQVFGIDVVVSEFIRRDLNTSGVFDNTTTNNTIEVLCNRTRFLWGQTREVRTESVRAPQALANWIQADARLDFQAIDKEKGTQIFASGDAPVAVGVDVTD
jgi:hypothetical protein